MTIIDEYLDHQLSFEKKYGPNTCVLMQIGYFYEVYALENYKEKINNENIRRLSSILNVQLTRKNKSIKENSRGNPMMIGVQVSGVDKYIQILLNNNYTTVIIDQVTEPPEPDREITYIHSPGTTVSHISRGETNNLLVVYIETTVNLKTLKNIINIGLCVIDLSIGKSIVYETISKLDDKNYSLDEVYRFIHIHNPTEIVISMTNSEFTKQGLSKYFEVDESIIHFIEKTEPRYSKLSYQKTLLEKVYPCRGVLSAVEYIDMEFYPHALISFIIALDFAYSHNESIIKKIEKPEIWEQKGSLVLTNNSVSQLNIVSSPNNSYGKFNSLLSVMDNTSTAIGKRKLKDRLLNPIVDETILNIRYDTISSMMSNQEGNRLYKSFETVLERVSDIERLHRKISLKLIQPSDFVSLDISYDSIKDMIDLCKKSRCKLLHSLVPDSAILDNLYNFICYYKEKFNMDEICKYHLDKINGSFYNNGVYDDVDSVKEVIDTNTQRFNIICKKLSDLTEKGSNFVKLDKTEKEGYFLNITEKRSQLLKKRFVNTKYCIIKIDNDFSIDPRELEFKKIRHNTVKITCSRIQELGTKIRTGRDKIGDICREKFIEILGDIDIRYISGLKKMSDFVGIIDVYKSAAKTAVKYGYTRPSITNDKSSYIDTEGIRHPIIERIQTDIEYVTNDLVIGKSDNKGILLFGTNASGKSSLMKAIGINIIMAQSGFFVAASSFKYSPYRYLFTRINNNDNIFKGESSFAVEMNELRSILKRSGENSLVLGDELCSGTESVSALSIFASSVDFLVKKNTSFIFATHLHELCRLEIIKMLEKSIKLFHLKVIYDKESGKLVYNRKLTDGSGNAIYGLEVCKSMDMDEDFIKTATSIRKKIMNIQEGVISNKQSKYNADIYVDHCLVCSKPAEDVHHIKFQCSADSNNMIGHIQKDVKSNLVPLCKECHIQTHNSNLVINGYIQTSNGIELDFKYLEKTEMESKKKKRKKFSENQVDDIKLFISSCGKISMKNICTKLKTEKQIDISTNTLTKIKKNIYINLLL